MKDALDRLNALEIWDFQVERARDGTLLILGSNDFVYYHNVEIEFSGVEFSNVRELFSHAEFLLSPSADPDASVQTIYVLAEGAEYRIRAAAVDVRIGTVHYTKR